MIYSNLPAEIVRHVYEYDSTYHDEFKNNVLPCLDILHRPTFKMRLKIPKK